MSFNNLGEHGPAIAENLAHALSLHTVDMSGLLDILLVKHTILRNYPVIGHLRYMLESIRPEIQQYFVESDKDGMPFSREIRSLVYQKAKGARETVPFGTKMISHLLVMSFPIIHLFPNM